MTEAGPKVTLLRHGETPWSRGGQHTGRTDVDLTSTGEVQAVRLRAALTPPYDVVLVSPMRRARRTAALAGLDGYEVDEDLREWDYGSLEGLTTAEIQTKIPGWSIWAGPWPDGETSDAVGARADRVVARLLAVGPGATVACVAHGHILRVLAARWLDAEVAWGRFLALDTATVSELGWEHDYRVVRRWNQPPPP